MQGDVYGLGGRGSDVMVWNATSAGLGHHTFPIHTAMGWTTQDTLWLLGVASIAFRNFDGFPDLAGWCAWDTVSFPWHLTYTHSHKQ